MEGLLRYFDMSFGYLADETPAARAVDMLRARARNFPGEPPRMPPPVGNGHTPR
jgi:hypothetical protein